MSVLASWFLCVVASRLILAYDITDVKGIDYTNHSCNRKCDGKPLLCEYIFVAEWYYTMSKACYNCATNDEDCSRKHCIVMDGTPRPVVSINRQVPGPAIRVCEGDTIRVRLSNQLDDGQGVSLHWHGLHQKTTPYMDGATMVTQCPVAAGTTFNYTFEASPPGTYWYHSHAGYQRSDGMVGSLVIKQTERRNIHSKLYDYDLPGHVIAVSDWGSDTFHRKELRSLHFARTSLLDNAVFMMPFGITRVYDSVTGQSVLTQRPILKVTKWKKYRFRAGHFGSIGCALEIMIDNHIMTVIAIDGADVKHYDVSSFILLSGERVDFVITANQPIGNYWVRMKADFCGNHNKQGILRYNDAPEIDPTTTEWIPTNNLYKQLLPVLPADGKKRIAITDMAAADSVAHPGIRNYNVWAAGQSSITKFIRVDFNIENNPIYNDPVLYPNSQVSPNQRVITPMLNNVAYMHPKAPLLTQAWSTTDDELCDPTNTYSFDRQKHCQNEFCKCVNVMKLPMNEVVDMVLYIEGSVVPRLPHPIHLHGYHFYVLARGTVEGGLTDQKIKDMHETGKIKLNTVDPVLKDTVVVPSSGYVVIRILTNNPGVWFMHCHFENHFSLGMAMVVQVGTRFDFKQPPPDFPRCGKYVEPPFSFFFNQYIPLTLPKTAGFTQFDDFFSHTFGVNPKPSRNFVPPPKSDSKDWFKKDSTDVVTHLQAGFSSNS